MTHEKTQSTALVPYQELGSSPFEHFVVHLRLRLQSSMKQASASGIWHTLPLDHMLIAGLYNVLLGIAAKRDGLNMSTGVVVSDLGPTADYLFNAGIVLGYGSPYLAALAFEKEVVQPVLQDLQDARVGVVEIFGDRWRKPIAQFVARVMRVPLSFGDRLSSLVRAIDRDNSIRLPKEHDLQERLGLGVNGDLACVLDGPQGAVPGMSYHPIVYAGMFSLDGDRKSTNPQSVAVQVRRALASFSVIRARQLLLRSLPYHFERLPMTVRLGVEPSVERNWISAQAALAVIGAPVDAEFLTLEEYLQAIHVSKKIDAKEAAQKCMKRLRDRGFTPNSDGDAEILLGYFKRAVLTLAQQSGEITDKTLNGQLIALGAYTDVELGLNDASLLVRGAGAPALIESLGALSRVQRERYLQDNVMRPELWEHIGLTGFLQAVEGGPLMEFPELLVEAFLMVPGEYHVEILQWMEDQSKLLTREAWQAFVDAEIVKAIPRATARADGIRYVERLLYEIRWFDNTPKELDKRCKNLVVKVAHDRECDFDGVEANLLMPVLRKFGKKRVKKIFNRLPRSTVIKFLFHLLFQTQSPGEMPTADVKWMMGALGRDNWRRYVLGANVYLRISGYSRDSESMFPRWEKPELWQPGDREHYAHLLGVVPKNFAKMLKKFSEGQLIRWLYAGETPEDRAQKVELYNRSRVVFYARCKGAQGSFQG